VTIRLPIGYIKAATHTSELVGKWKLVGSNPGHEPKKVAN